MGALTMISRFRAYVVCHNLRLFEPFFILFLLLDQRLGLDEIGVLVGYQKILTAVLEGPSGVVADHWGRRRSLMLHFALLGVAIATYTVLAVVGSWTAGLWLAQTTFGLAEAFRTGSHKAIVLDWLDLNGQAERSTEVLASLRTWSKLSAGAAGLGAGLVMFFTGSWMLLFALSLISATVGLLVVARYPRHLEGEVTRGRVKGGRVKDPDPPVPRPRRLDWLRRPGLASLLVASVAFESAIKLALHYLQPAFADTLEHRGLTSATGLGALLLGGYTFIQGALAGAASRGAPWLRRRCGGQTAALGVVHRLTLVVLVGLVFLWWFDARGVALVAFVSVAALQNLRRPLFVAALGQVVDKARRATTLSVESQARQVVLALGVAATGWLAEMFGLRWAFVCIAGLAGLAVVRLRSSSPPREPVASSGS